MTDTMFYISYFYQLRFFNQSILPVSTAIFDPKWFHQNQTQLTMFRDKNNVVNGFRYPTLSPEKIYDAHSDCSDSCQKSPDTCEFLNKYEDYLNSLDFDWIVANLQA